MDLVRSWVAAVAAFLAANLVIGQVAVKVTTAEALASTGGMIAWNAVSGFLVYMITVLSGALFHRAPWRDDPRRHALAVLPVPAAVVLYSLVYALLSGVIVGTVVSVVAGAAGGLVAGGATVWWRERRVRSFADDSGYL